MYETDFTHRAIPGTLYGTSNLSMNMPKDFIDTHNNRIQDDMFGGDEFFGLQPEGPEDTHPAMKLFERYLQRRARKPMNLREEMKQAVLGALKRGETVVTPTFKRTVQTQKRNVRILLQPDGSAALDSRGSFISELDQWQPVIDNPAKEYLVRDPRVIRPAGVVFPLSERTVGIMQPIESIGGADIAIPYWGDIVTDIHAKDIRKAYFARVYELYPDEVLDMLAPTARTAQVAEWLKQTRGHTPAKANRSDQVTEVVSRGELEPSAVLPDGNDLQQAPRLIAEMYFQADLDGDGRRENVCMVLDISQDSNPWPVVYDYAHEVMPWAPESANPARVIRINPVENRWYGIGYYDELRDMHDYCDKLQNRNEIEIAKSGNLLFENREATEEGKAGMPLKFRTLQTFKKRGDSADGKAPVEVVTVTPQTAEIDAALDRTLQRLQAAKGAITPADAQTANLQAANTARGMEILQQTGDRQLKAREAEMLIGINDVLGDMAEIEAHSLDLEFARKVFQAKDESEEVEAEQPEAQPTEEQAEGEPKPENALVLAQWLELNKGNIAGRVQVSLARKSPTQIIEQSKLVDETMAAWFQMPPPVQEVMRDTYATRLRALDVQNPDAMLVTIPINSPNPNDPNNGQQPGTAAPQSPGS